VPAARRRCRAEALVVVVRVDAQLLGLMVERVAKSAPATILPTVDPRACAGGVLEAGEDEDGRTLSVLNPIRLALSLDPVILAAHRLAA